MKQELTTIKVLPSSIKKLNIIAANEGLKQYEVVEQLASDRVEVYDVPALPNKKSKSITQ